jgi:hypothetical protein
VETANLVLVSRASPIQYSQHGPVHGTFNGEMALDAKITAAGVAVTFTVQLDGGTVSGTGLAIPRITGGPTATLSGTAAVTMGTGKFAGIHGRGLRVTGTVRTDATSGTVRLSGTVVY